jgi:predicted AlkP superfamily phosphohydrolase/phosphomutase
MFRAPRLSSLSGMCAAVVALALPLHQANAYIGPGAGFAFLGSGAVFLLTLGLGLLTIFLWPLQYLWRIVRGSGRPKEARVRRAIILGLDGLDPNLLEKYLAEGKLPNFAKLKEQGSYSRLGTTLPALSPVAWSTFQTGVNPGAHNIFDFLSRDKRFCLPELSAVRTETVRKEIKIGPFRIPRTRAEIRLMRRSQPFWKLLGARNIMANIIRVPISYPPEKFNGNILSAMCTPDLRGTQGTFTLFTTRKDVESSAGGDSTGGEVHTITRNGDELKGEIQGPPHLDGKSGNLSVSFLLRILDAERAELLVQSEREVLTLNSFSRWIPVTFALGRKKIQGIVRVCLREAGEHVTLYVSPVNVDPARPALPISYPLLFSSWLAKRQGSFGTLGLLEDTWGRNELALDDRRFLDQAWLSHEERKKMFFETLKRTREGVCICVFDASDRIQHMFWRYIDPKHPSPVENVAEFGDTIPEMYRRMDALVGETMEQLGSDDVLMILSDHGFSSFRRCVNLNTWLFENGYLATKGDKKPEGLDYLQEVDWSRTKAFALGLSGLYLNKKGRERFGILSDEEGEVVKREIIAKLSGLVDPQDGTVAIKKVYDTRKAYKGLYTNEAPDLIVGYYPGYRVSWDSITGTIEPQIFSDNLKAWSGDHHVDPEEVPGIFFVNQPLKTEAPHIIDIAPTTLDLFGIKPPSYMEGRVIV